MFSTTIQKVYRQANTQEERGLMVLVITKKFLGITYSRTEHYIEH